MKKGTTILLLALLAVVCLAVSCKNDPPPHVHTYDMTSWEKDDDNHWHKATCEHKEEVKDKAEHTWDEGVKTKPAGYGTAGERTYTCTVCEKTKTEPIAALEAKDCSVAFATGYSPNSSYNGKPIAIDKSKVVRIANGETTAIDDPSSISFMFKTSGADDSTYSEEAPSNSGSYIVKIKVAESAEWKECSQTFDFTISPAKLSLKAGKDLVFEFDNESTTFTVNAVNVFDGLAEGEAQINLVVEFNGKDAGSTHKAHCLEIGSSHANASNYVLAEAVETKLANAKISPKTVYLSGEYTFFRCDSTTGINFMIPSGLPDDNVELKVKLDRKGNNWQELDQEYDFKSCGYTVSLYEPNKNYEPRIADSGAKVVIKTGNGTVLTEEIENDYTTKEDGYLVCHFKKLKKSTRYSISVIPEGKTTPVSHDRLTMLGKEAYIGGTIIFNIQNITTDREFVFNGITNDTATLYVKGEPNTKYKVKVSTVN